MTPLAAAMTVCLAACHPRGPEECLTWGYDQEAEACICKTPAGGQKHVAIDPPLVEPKSEGDEAFERSLIGPGGRAALFSDPSGRERVAEILVFPNLILGGGLPAYGRLPEGAASMDGSGPRQPCH